MTRANRAVMASLALIGLASTVVSRAEEKTKIVVYKNPTCMCCAKWIDHMARNGFEPVVHDVKDVVPIKNAFDVPKDAFSCHTAVIEGYIIEGHVPATEILRLLKERPAVAGLSVPGMPTGSPGMEGAKPQPYDVLTFDSRRPTAVFASYGR
jgi:hypothetical protein